VEERQQAADAFAQRIKPVIAGMIARGLSQRAMVAELNAIKVPAPKGGDWRLSQLQRVKSRLA
jgi:hypothetical protein